MKKIQLHLLTFGARLRAKDGLFEVSYKPKGKNWKKQQIAPIRVESILLNRHCSLSVESALLAMQHDIDIILSDEFSNPVGRVWHLRPSSTTAVLKEQTRASVDGRGLLLAQGWIVEKLQNMANFLKQLQVTNAEQEKIGKAIIHIDKQVERIKKEQPEAESLRGLEGTASRIYFQTIGQLLPTVFRFDRRSRRPAEDLFNAALNYGYGLLYKEVDKALLLAGLSPYVGFLHRDGYQNRALTFDFIEPYRIWGDRVVFGLFETGKMNRNLKNKSGSGVQLNITGKEIVARAIRNYLLDEKIFSMGNNTNRHFILKSAATELAKSLKK